jgi:hypothetical protein
MIIELPHMKRTPWWLFVLAGSFLAYFCLLIYCDILRPEPTGMIVDFTDDAMVVRRVTPGSPGAIAGLQPGDRILSFNGRALRDSGWMFIDANLEIDSPMPLDVDRAGDRVTAALTLHRAPWSYWQSQDGWMLLAVRAVQLVTLCLAFVIAIKRSFDPSARLGAWLLATVGVFCVVLPYRIAAVWRQLPVVPGALLWIPYVSSVAVAAILAAFVAMFPRKVSRSRHWWMLAWVPMALALVQPTSYMLQMVYQTDRWYATSFGGSILVAVSVWYIAWGLTMLVVNYRRLDDVTERRRLRIVVMGLLVGCLLGLPVIPIYWLRTTGDLDRPLFKSPLSASLTFVMLVIPLSFTYAILRHRLFDVSVMIRQGVRYALARHLVLWLVPGCAIALLADVALMHRQDALVAVFQAHVWIYVAVGGVAILAHRRRKRWLDLIDRRFFRERYHAQRLLGQVAADLREAQSFEQVAPLVVAQLESALHSAFAALLFRPAGGDEYRVIACAPAGQAPPPIDARSKLIALVTVLGRPVETTGTDWLARQLPRAEQDFIRDARIEMFVPVAAPPALGAAVLALGAKRSEEPYTQDDQDLLSAIADSLALLLERPSIVPPAAGSFEACPECGTCYPAGTAHCASEGTPLTTIAAPHVLAGRYRLQRRLGTGGMGTVYAANDTALERVVAVKLIREDLVGQPDAAERFQREARTAASFAHPHVVTVHDFGVTAGRHAYLVMEMLEGATLRDTMRERQTMSPARTIDILRGVCAAIDAAHRRRLIHRDLKPENIFLVQSAAAPVAKVLDFGIAKSLAPDGTGLGRNTTAAGVLLGTLRYMAPEQLRGEDAQPAWDIWALAVIAYEMLMGAHPFASASHAPRETGSTWQPFFARSLSLDPAERPESAASFFAALQNAAAESGL